MRVLILANKFPFPPNDGSSLAIYNLACGLMNEAEVTIFTLNTSKHHKNPADVPEPAKTKIDWYVVDVKTDITLWGALLNLMTKAPYHASRFCTKKTQQKLTQLLQKKQFNVIQLETAYMGGYLPIIRTHSQAKVVLRAHNVESLLWQRTAQQSTHPIKKWYLQLQTQRLQNFERQLCKKVDAIVPISEIDGAGLQTFAPHVPQCCIPFGLDVETYQNNAGPAHLIHFLGSMDWLPNQTGLRWFLTAVWPLVAAAHPEAKFVAAGKNMPAEFFKFANHQTKIESFVPDAMKFIEAAGIFVVPILSGSGIRIKMIEALAAGKPLVATTIGAEGIAGESGRDFVLADTPEAFAKELLILLKNPEKQVEIGKNARILAETHFSNKQLTTKLLHFYKSL